MQLTVSLVLVTLVLSSGTEHENKSDMPYGKRMTEEKASPTVTLNVHQYVETGTEQNNLTSCYSVQSSTRIIFNKYQWQLFIVIDMVKKKIQGQTMCQMPQIFSLSILYDFTENKLF